ncbi:MAG: HlyD family secretion protein [Gammaproteobacteria bacterium]
MKLSLTGLVIALAVVLVWGEYREQAVNPWTRDGQVRADVIQITPRVSGPIVTLAVRDNQFVEAGDLLFEIDPRTFAAARAQASAQYDQARDAYLAQEQQVEAVRAQVEAARAEVVRAESAVKQIDSTIEKNQAEFDRQQEMLPKRATSQKAVDRAKANFEVSLEQRKGAIASLGQARAALRETEAELAETRAKLGALGDANASIRAARASLDQAELNVEFTRVVAPVDGYVTNLNLRIGSHAVANQPVLALVDVNSYWVHGFFKETRVGEIDAGDRARVTLMSFPDVPLEGYVDSVGWGIAQQDGSVGADLLPNVNPTFEWIRLAQRVPVRIHLTDVPAEVELRVGTTASVQVMTTSDDARPAARDGGVPQANAPDP